MVMVKGQIKRNTVIKTLNPGNHSNKSMYLKISSVFAFKRLRCLENYSGRGITLHTLFRHIINVDNVSEMKINVATAE